MGSGNKFIVQKFGGTSIGQGKRLCNVASIVIETLKTYYPIVVLSAMSGYVKTEGTTSLLLQAANSAISKDMKEMHRIISKLKTYHIVAIHEALGECEASSSLQLQINEILDRLKSFLEAIQVIGELSHRSIDIVIGTGERLSALIFSAVLRSQGVQSCAVDLSEVLDETREFEEAEFYHIARQKISQHIVNFCSWQPEEDSPSPDPNYEPTLSSNTYLHLKNGESSESLPNHCAGFSSLNGLIPASEKFTPSTFVVPVVTGFFGFVPGGIIDTVGRGYSDFTAALIASGLGVEELQVWKEVDGIYSADPKQIPDACLLMRITPSEAAELSFYGSEVIHPFTMEQVINHKIPIRIKNAFNPTAPGTVIVPTNTSLAPHKNHLHQDAILSSTSCPAAGSSADAPLVDASLRAASSNSYRRYVGVVAVTAKRDIFVLQIKSNRQLGGRGFFAKVFCILERYKLSVDIISTSIVDISMTLDCKLHSLLMDAIPALTQVGQVNIKENMAIVSVIGQQMRNTIGVSAAFFAALSSQNINVEMISQGASEINISCVISQDKVPSAMKALHDSMISNAPGKSSFPDG